MKLVQARHLFDKWIEANAKFDILSKMKKETASTFGLKLLEEGLFDISIDRDSDPKKNEILMRLTVINPSELEKLLARAWELGASYGDPQSLAPAKYAYDKFIECVRQGNPNNTLGL